MKRLLFALAALSLLSTIIPAKAACPPDTAYNCVQMPNGKMSWPWLAPERSPISHNQSE
jgi:hypothetical protein